MSGHGGAVNIAVQKGGCSAEESHGIVRPGPLPATAIRHVRRRIAFIDYFPTHYRRGLYEELSRRMTADFYFYADERERYWNRKLPLVQDGDFRRVELRRLRIAGEPFMPGIVGTLRRERYDAVVKSLNGRVMLPLTYLTAQSRGVAFVLWTGMWFHPRTVFHRISRLPTESLYRHADAIVAYGEHVRRFVALTRGVDADKVYVAGQAVDAAPFAAVEPRFDKTVAEILYVGQFEERKGLAFLLDAFDRLRREGLPARLRLIGNGSMEEAIRRKGACNDAIELVGHVAQHDLPAHLARARCLVLPSITTSLDREPWGLVCNEAMHAGIPVVASDAVGAAAGGLVRDGRNGFVVPEKSAEALAGALRRLVADARVAEEMGASARTDVRVFDHRRMADGFEAAIDHAITARSGRPMRPRREWPS
jgi:glycosyltransferase involved in cell wall biosynthesis